MSAIDGRVGGISLTGSVLAVDTVGSIKGQSSSMVISTNAPISVGVTAIDGISGNITVTGYSPNGSGVGTNIVPSGQTITVYLTTAASAGINQHLASSNI